MKKPDWITQGLWDDMTFWEQALDQWVAISVKKLDTRLLGPAVADMLERIDEAEN